MPQELESIRKIQQGAKDSCDVDGEYIARAVCEVAIQLARIGDLLEVYLGAAHLP